MVEELAKAAPVLLVFAVRRRQSAGPADGLVAAGFTATGFAFTENILYLGNAYGQDLASGTGVLESMTAATFFVRVMVSPFAHPLFTVLSGLGFGAATLGAGRARRFGLPAAGLALAMGTHALWNSSSRFGEYGFAVVYGSVMVPVFGVLLWLAVRMRRRRLRAVAAELAVYASAGWLAPAEVPALASMPARSLACALARHSGGRAARRAVSRYAADAAALALLRRRARRGGPAWEPEFTRREGELLRGLWLRRATAGPALSRAAVLEELLPPRAADDPAWWAGPGAPAGVPAPRRSDPSRSATPADPSSSHPCALPGGGGLR
ncbi:hypothetical protein GCM10020254_45920 [Streptomyces goshikiensis]